MYNVLVVDDEKMAADGLLSALEELADANLDLYKAYSAEEALACFRKVRIDVLVTDIKMPNMNGLELHEVVQNGWPRCKVIFLSGYDDFHFAQSAMKLRAFDYILKTDGDEAVVDALYRALEQIRLEANNRKLLAEAQAQFEERMPVMRKELALELLGGGLYSLEELGSRFDKLRFPLTADEPACLLLGRIDDWKLLCNREQKLECIEKIAAIAGDYLKERVRLLFTTNEAYEMIWILQPTEGRQEEMLQYVEHALEPIQTSCDLLLEMSVSFVFGTHCTGFGTIARTYEKLRHILLHVKYGSGERMILSDSAEPATGKIDSDEWIQWRQKLNRFGSLFVDLEGGNIIRFRAMFGAYLDELAETKDLPYGLAVELYYTIALTFQTYMNKLGIVAGGNEDVDLTLLMRMDKHVSLSEFKAYFIGLAEWIHQVNGKNKGDRTNEIVGRIQNHIHANLDGDLSVAALAEAVHLNQSYLSRLFKQVVGTPLSHYIADVKLEKAKEMLLHGELKIYDIARSLGFLDQSYFAQFFRRYTQMAPQDYRMLMSK